MARVKLSETGDLHVPTHLRESLGLVPGAEVDVTESAGRMVVALVPAVAPEDEAPRKLTVEEFLAKRIRYDGPPITDAMIDQTLLDEAKRRWDNVQRQWNEGAREDSVD